MPYGTNVTGPAAQDRGAGNWNRKNNVRTQLQYVVSLSGDDERSPYKESSICEARAVEIDVNTEVE